MSRLIPIIIAQCLGFFIFSDLVGQPIAQWKKLPYNPVPPSRLNDCFFVTPSLGWVVNGVGQILRTVDGGISWQKQVDKTSKTHFRSIGFVDSLTGWAGCLGIGDPSHPEVTDTTILYKTTDGGTSWLPVSGVSGSVPRGFCGLHVLNDSVINAVGRVRGPAYFYRTTDRGRTWVVKDMNSYAAGLIDVYFTHPDTGFAVGLTNANHDSSGGIILFTTDGGKTWQTRFRTTRKGEWSWKINFPSRKVGYVSLQRNTLSPIYFLKTTDGGTTWLEKLFSSSYYFVQGIGFATDTLGWIGGWSTELLYETRNGGETWYPIGIGRRINRFRMISSTLGYAVGDSVYKYAPSAPVEVAANEGEVPAYFALKQNYPNPFNPSTEIRFTLDKGGMVALRVYDVLGREVATLVNEELPTGAYRTRFDAPNLPSGVYFYVLMQRGIRLSNKMLLVK